MEALLVAENHAAPVIALAFSPGVSDSFCTASADGIVRIWDAGDYSVRMNASSGKAVPQCLLYSDEVVIVGCGDGQIRSYHSSSGEALWTIANAHSSGITALAMSPNFKFIVSGGNNGEIRVWEIKSRELVCHLKEHSARVNGIKVYSDNMHVVSCSRDRSFLCWDLQQERRVSSHLQRMGGINALALSKDQQMIITVGQEKKISFWTLQNENPVNTIFPAHSAEAICLDVSNNGLFIVTGSADHELKLWSKDGTNLATGIGHSGPVSAVSFSPDDKQIVSVGMDGSIFIWNVYM